MKTTWKTISDINQKSSSFMYKTNKKLLFVILSLLFVWVIPFKMVRAASAPSTVTDLSGFSSESAVNLAWTAPANNGAAITDYSVQYRTTGSAPWTVFSHSAITGSTVSVTGLTDATSYDFEVAAINSSGTATYSNIATAKPLALQKTDGFESYSANSNINGQGGWVTANPGSGSVWNVQSGNGGQVVVNTAGSTFPNNVVVLGGSSFTDSGITADFQANGGAFPMLWLRRNAATGQSGGYVLFQAGGSFYLSAQSSTDVNTRTDLKVVTSPITLSVGTYYTISFQVYNNTSGNPVFSAWLTPVGTPPGTPFLTYTDTANNYASPGFTGFGSNNNVTDGTYDNVSVYGTISPTGPAAVSDLAGLSGDGSVALAWTTPAMNGSAITDYSVQYRTTGSSPWTTFSHSAITGSAVTVTGLTDATSYDFEVAAINGIGTGAYSNIATAKPLALQKSDNFESYAANSNLNGQGGWVTTNPTTGSIWDVQSGNGGQVVTNIGSVDGVPFNVPPFPNDIVILGGNSLNDSRIAADFQANASGSFPMLWLRRNAATGMSGGYVLFEAGGLFYLSAQSTTNISNRTDFTNISSPITLTAGSYYTLSFQVYNNTSGNPVLSAWLSPAGAAPGTPFITYTDTANTFASRGYSGFGSNSNVPSGTYDNVSVYGNITSITPDAITTLYAEPAIGAVTLNWTTPFNGAPGITNYNIRYRATGTSPWTTFAHSPSAATSATITGLTNGASYDFDVNAINSVGTSTDSNIATATPTSAGTYYLVLSGGQSLSTGHIASPALSVTQPYNNLMFTPGVEGAGTPLVPLIESGQGENGGVETPSSGIANSLSGYTGNANPFIVGLDGHNSTDYAGLSKETSSPYYTRAITQTQNAYNYIQSIGGNLVPLAVTITHGESDYFEAHYSTYEADLEQWQSDFQSDVNAISGSSATLPMVISQVNSVLNGQIAQDQLQAHLDNPGKIILAGPKYQLSYAYDHAHLTDTSSRYLGELYAKVINWVQLQHKVWNPLMPTQVLLNGNKIDISYAIPVGSLAIDTSNVAQRTNDGFVFTQTGGNSPSITNVALVANNTQVELTLSAVPTGTNQQVQYAYSCPSVQTNYCAESSDPTMVGGNIRDTDTSVSPALDSTNLPLYDWSVAYAEPVAVVPSAPSTLTATPGYFQATLSWTAPSTGGSPITDYVVQYRRSGSNNWATFTHTASTATTQTIQGITPGISYDFQVAAVNIVGTGPFSTLATTTPTATSISTGSGGGGGGGPTGIPASTTPIATTSTALYGSLVNDHGTFYLISGSSKMGITNPGILASYGHTFSQAVPITSAQAALSSVSNLPPNNGALVKTADNPTVYLISGSQRYGFASGKVFTSFGYSFASVLTVTTPELDQLTVAAPLTDPSRAHMPGTNILVNGTVYWIGPDNLLHAYPSLEVYNSWNIPNDFSRVVTANSADVLLPIGSVEPGRS